MVLRICGGCFLLIFLNVLPARALLNLDLGGNTNWKVQNLNLGYNLSATVPGGIYTDLMQNNIIDDVFNGFNDVKTRWVSKIPWNYTRMFLVNQDILTHNNINLIFDGVDTFSKILINDVVVGVTENMFLRYIFDIKSHIRIGENTISVQFESPVNVANSKYEKQAQSYAVPPLCVPKEYHGECHVNHIRKMQASFGWDWGPAFPSVGIWKNVYLEAYNYSMIRDVTVNIFSNPITNNWDMVLYVYFANSCSSDLIEGTLITKLVTDKGMRTNIDQVIVKEDNKGDFVWMQNMTIPKMHVSLWWPNGHGESKLYEMKISYISPNKQEKTIKTIKIGYRTIELVQNKLKNGRTFYFKINDVPIFAKGANMIPINILPELGQNKTSIERLLKAAKDVHMNMLRVWGGGVYESDAFYELADELGLMIWQDFMFACSMYPTNPDFLSNVRNEVKHQVRRLQHHPSIVLWAGSNENEAALSENWYGTKANLSLYKQDFVKLYVGTIKSEVLANDFTRPYLTSSPTNGIESDEENYVAKNPQSKLFGDVHYYNYFMDGFKTLVYPVSRFASEYGYQSLPSVRAILTATNDTEDIAIDSDFLINRQHHFLGYAQMQLLIQFQLELPYERSKNFDKAYIFYSQIIQAMSIKIETEFYRLHRSCLNDVGEGLTMGALYWQLNDVWVAPSWASIDIKQNWKMVHYYAKNFFAPVIITSNFDIIGGKLDVFVVSDLVQPILGAVAYINVFRWDSFNFVHSDVIALDIQPGFSKKIATYAITGRKVITDSSGKDAIKNCFVYLTLNYQNGTRLAPYNYAFLSSFKSANLQTPTLKISNVTQTGALEFQIEIKSSGITLFVWLDTNGIRGQFSDNGFLQITPHKVIQFYAEESATLTQFKNALTLTNLLDSQYL